MPHIDVKNGMIRVFDCYDQKETIKDIGGRWNSPSSAWEIIFTMYNIDQVLDKMENLTVSAELEAQVVDQKAREEKIDRIQQASKTNRDIPLNVSGLNATLYTYQKYGTAFAIANGQGMLLADQMGLGKSIQALAVSLMMKKREGAKKILIVVPASLKYNWPIEIAKFTNEKAIVIDGKASERVSQWLDDSAFFYVVNYELLREDFFGGANITIKRSDTEKQKASKLKRMTEADKRSKILSGVSRKMWDVIVLDEGHSIKNPSSTRTANVKKLKGKFRMVLTGTPLDGRLEELHSVMDFVAPGVLGSRRRFLNRYCDQDEHGAITGYKRVGEVRERMKPFFLRRLKADVLPDLPPKMYKDIVIPMSPKERKIYKALADKGHEATEDEEAVVAIIRCKQFCNYPPMIDDGCKSTSKLDAFKAVLEEVVLENGEKMILFTQYKEMLEILCAVLKEKGVNFLRIDGDTKKKDRANMQDQFRNDPAIDLIAGTDAMSTGLNLQAASYVVNYDDSWSPAIMDQRADRAHRIGTVSPVTVVNFVCKGTVEERIRSFLAGKRKVSAEVLGDGVECAGVINEDAKELTKYL